MACVQGIWTFISKDLTTPCKQSFSLPLSLCDHHIRLSPASLQNSTSSTPAQQPNTCSQCFFLQDQRMESISHLLQNGRWCMQMQIWIKMRFPVANILLLKTCNSTSSLCYPEFCALPLSLLLSIFIHVTSFVSGLMLPALCLKRLKEEAPFIRLSTLSNCYWTQVRKLWSFNIGYQSTRLLLQWCCCANQRFLSHSREWQKLNVCFGSSARSRWALLSWWSLTHDEFHDTNKCWLHTWNGLCPRSQSHWRWRMPTLPRHSTKREVSCTSNKGRPGWRQEPPCLWDPQW